MKYITAWNVRGANQSLTATCVQLLAMIGEQFDESEEICGVVVSVRRAHEKIAIWTKTASNESAQVCASQ